MVHHLSNLLSRSWDALIRATGTTTLGFFVWVVALTAASWLATLATKWFELKRDRAAEPLRSALRASKLTGTFLTGIIFLMLLCLFEAFVVRTVYDDHEDFVAALRRLATKNSALAAEIEKRKHHIPTTDPVFSNLTALLRAFDIYRHALKGEPCVVMLTAPPDSGPLVSEVSQFSNWVSDCFTFGPMPLALDPDAEKETTEGMLEATIIFHADKDDKAAFQLFDNLSTELPLKRSYQLPSYRNYQLPPNTGLPHVVWLQFGPNTKWNSERR
jgi:hypothetical protein